ncbi:MAG: RagB/SusD family nutrient uptake outer membrane protein [Bacteroidaceae bacterium]|nr:RagB/SusD family nutrient uptake outer membrane protein [Bacteroidaceae bacterium]
MMRKIIYMFMMFVLLCTTSCLDKYPENAVLEDRAITTVDEADQAVIGIYSSFLSSSLYSGYLTLMPDIQSDLVYAVNGYSNNMGDIWRWNILATNGQIEAVYGSLYSVIGSCNFLLDNAAKLMPTLVDDEDVDHLETLCGEAYFARALAYSELIKLFCEDYKNDDDAKNKLGVVIRTSYYNEQPIVRSSLYDSYRQVLSDLDVAAKYLALDEDYDPAYDGYLYNYSTFFNEYTVYALRARVALYMRDYAEAVNYSSKVIDSKMYSLSSVNSEYSAGVSYYDLMWQNDLSTEVIWKVGFTASDHGGALGSIFFNYDYSSYKPDYVPAQWVLDLYAATDGRYNAFFRNATTGYSHGLTWPLVYKYWGNQDLYAEANLLNTSMPKVFRLSEQYLIRAEAYCNLETPDYSKAARDLSTLRAARYTSGHSVALSEDNAMKVIEEERVKELFMEGFRLQDLKRWGKGFERKPQDQSLSNGSSLKIDAGDPLFVWPIPQHEIESPGANIAPNASNK